MTLPPAQTAMIVVTVPFPGPATYAKQSEVLDANFYLDDFLFPGLLANPTLTFESTEQGRLKKFWYLF